MNHHRTATRTATSALALAASALLLTACADPAPGLVESGPLQAQWVDLPDGRVVVCVTALAAQWPAGGVDCDWASAGRESEPVDRSGEVK